MAVPRERGFGGEVCGMSARGMASNVELLTHSHNVIRAKKRQKLGQVKTVVFDDDARRCARYSIMTLGA
jgi:hypothetical protein